VKKYIFFNTAWRRCYYFDQIKCQQDTACVTFGRTLVGGKGRAETTWKTYT